MKEVLIVGASGGREEALKQAIEASGKVSKVVVSKDVKAGLDMFLDSKNKPFIVIGPEQTLVDGWADKLRQLGYQVFGVGSKASIYEASKAQTVKLARSAKVTHPETFIAEGDNMAKDAINFVNENNYTSYVIKADGLAAGKGVYLPESKEEALKIVKGLISGDLANGAGKNIINFAKRKKGPEVSAMVVVGQSPSDYVILPLSQDHKRAKDNDKGPNTGGMGAYAPVPQNIVSPNQYKKIDEMAYKLLLQMNKDGVEYKGGVMYMGLMMDEGLDGDPTLIEINVRFGDPETQVILPLLVHAGVDVFELLYTASTTGGLKDILKNITVSDYSAVTVCLASKGYGYVDKPQIGDIIYGIKDAKNKVTVQLAGVTTKDGVIKTNGGRVLYVTAVGKTVIEASDLAYSVIGDSPNQNKIFFKDMQYRKDIGWQAR